jgi:hypothetical protein
MDTKNVIKYSCKMGPNYLDWYRTIYFSLVASSLMTSFLKLSTLLNESGIFFLLGVLGFIIGLICSVRITERFKGWAVNYDKESKAIQLKLTPEKYFIEKESEYIDFYQTRFYKFLKIRKATIFKVQHLLFNFIVFPSFLMIGISGYFTEKRTSGNSDLTKESLGNIEKKLTRIDSTQNYLNVIIFDRSCYEDSVQTMQMKINKKNEEIDSLRTIITKARRKTL